MTVQVGKDFFYSELLFLCPTLFLSEETLFLKSIDHGLPPLLMMMLIRVVGAKFCFRPSENYLMYPTEVFNHKLANILDAVSAQICGYLNF